MHSNKRMRLFVKRKTATDKQRKYTTKKNSMQLER